MSLERHGDAARYPSKIGPGWASVSKVEQDSLPARLMEDEIVDAIRSNSFVVIQGDTGSGKTTQVPQILLNSYLTKLSDMPAGIIGITQPRKVAAIQLARRVAAELGPSGARSVGYQVRFEATWKRGACIKFMTEGILLRELQHDFLLRKYSIIILDEVHERGLICDLLVGSLSRAVRLRNGKADAFNLKPLKLVMMSATISHTDMADRIALFSEYPQVINIPSPGHKVKAHFAKHTRSDYVDEARRKVELIHRNLPPGGILVFLTGRLEIQSLSSELQRIFPFELSKEMEASNLCAVSEISLTRRAPTVARLLVLPLHSSLTEDEQSRVFSEPPPGVRVCILSTNVAETSLTIPGIRYVVDCGRVKRKVYCPITGLQRYQVQWISKASASQRLGRAGRTCPGHCYRLYSSAVFERDFADNIEPEICQVHIEGLVLLMKSMHIEKIDRFPFITRPSVDNLRHAESVLYFLRAVDSNGAVTRFGRAMNSFPVGPRFSKMLVLARGSSCMNYVIAIVAVLSVDVFSLVGNPMPDGSADDTREDRNLTKSTLQASGLKKFCAFDQRSDAFSYLSAICAFEFAADGALFCKVNGLNHRAMLEIRNLRQQLFGIVLKEGQMYCNFELKLPLPSPRQIRNVKHILAAAFFDQVATRADVVKPGIVRVHGEHEWLSRRYAIRSDYISDGATSTIAGYRLVKIHSSSILHGLQDLPAYVVYCKAQLGQKNSKAYLWPLLGLSNEEFLTISEKLKKVLNTTQQHERIPSKRST